MDNSACTEAQFDKFDINSQSCSSQEANHLAEIQADSKDIGFVLFCSKKESEKVGKGFNRDSWNKLEKHVRHLVKQYKNVYVCTGPLYLPRFETDGKKYVKYEVIGSNNVAVPTHFFKVVVGETENREFDMEAYVMPNIAIEDSVPLKSFLVPRDTIERAAGFLLFEKLPPSAFRKINGLKV